MGEWDSWIGRTRIAHDRADEPLVRRWCATLDRPLPADATAPQGLHWCLCLPDEPSARLAADGHPIRDDSLDSFLPPVPLPRRMWAGSAIDFLAPIPVGAPIERRSQVRAITPRQGATGALVFVEVEHLTHADGIPAVREVHTIVYREPAGGEPTTSASAATPFDAAAWTAHRTLTPNEALLFRYSALTFNGHRIHYDHPYVTQVEGYRGLIVHGPLIATLLLDLARREHGENALRTFRFRALSPAICGEVLHLGLRPTAEGMELGAFGPDGTPLIAATATIGQ
ncbi:MAG: hypothetical protein RIS94_1974 [Pseudomonadota bacterium]|jgi:3-methylfumaryl-CoA hydratase